VDDAGQAAEENRALLRSFERALRQANRSPRTLQSYRESAELLAAFCPTRRFPNSTRDEMSEFVTDQLARQRPTSAAVRFRALRRFYNWLVDEEIMTASPMARMIEPAAPEQPVPILSDAELAALLKATTGKEFEQRRDHAMIRLFLDCGIRVGEMAGLALEDVDLDTHDVIHVVGKGSRGRAVPFGAKTGTAPDRYLRARRTLTRPPAEPVDRGSGRNDDQRHRADVGPTRRAGRRHQPAPPPVSAHVRPPLETRRRRRG
jgi:site-specific recombinase XerD